MQWPDGYKDWARVSILYPNSGLFLANLMNMNFALRERYGSNVEPVHDLRNISADMSFRVQ